MKTFGTAEFKNLLADLSLQLADAKMKMASLIHENAELHEKVDGLEGAVKAKSLYVYRFGLKWDEHFNPICPIAEHIFPSQCMLSNERVLALVAFNVRGVVAGCLSRMTAVFHFDSKMHAPKCLQTRLRRTHNRDLQLTAR